MNKLVVTAYVHEDCDVCAPTLQALDDAGISYRRVNLRHTPELTARLRLLGITETPVVEAGDLVWCGYRPDLITLLAHAITRHDHGGSRR